MNHEISAPPIASAENRTPAPVPSAQVIQLVFRASLSELLRRRRLVFIGLVCLLPLILTAIWRIWGMEHLPAQEFFTNLVSFLYLQILIYLVALAFGVPTVHDEIEGRTITYLFTRPIRKEAVFAGKLMAVQLMAGILLALSLVVCFAMMVAGNLEILSLEFVKIYINHVLIILFATIVLTALFAIIGTAFGKPLVVGILYAFGWEGLVAKVPGQLQTWTLDFHIRNLVMGRMDVQQGLMDVFRNLLTEDAAVGAMTSLGILLVLLLIFMVVGGWVFSRKEYVIN